ncbi:MAG: hypothetical protein CVV22_07975 [Ignavibacteriae bacterium HGW-Ignavibacteriae-1]|jgi:SAM-dependent methyltransferase|nr:MAG: hypothetical protein CVV22_07975 [Ignavibacteriae bacterium HGW-Ignavibacteriae-1]
MRKFNNGFKDNAYLAYRWLSQFIDPIKFAGAFPRYFRFFGDWIRYRNADGAEKIRFVDTYPNLHDRMETTPFDRHYFYQDIWAYKKIYDSKAPEHIDVGSSIKTIGLLTAVTHVTFVDIRPLNANLSNYKSVAGSILEMPYETDSVNSLSCLHVAEHIGLGRYGDPLDPFGTKKACKELQRILAPNGNLYFSLPVGKPRLCFNAHRIHSPTQILEYFDKLQLVELSGIDDDGNFIQNIDISILENSDYACGLFQFTKL